MVVSCIDRWRVARLPLGRKWLKAADLGELARAEEGFLWAYRS